MPVVRRSPTMNQPGREDHEGMNPSRLSMCPPPLIRIFPLTQRTVSLELRATSIEVTY